MDRTTLPRISTLTVLTALTTLTMFAAGCGSDSTSAPQSPVIEYGTPVEVGDGHARAYVMIDDANGGIPLELGIALDEDALQGLPAPSATPPVGHPESYAFLLPLPTRAPAPYKLVELDWNPAGHPPPHVYQVPHFDFHFYDVSLADRNTIMPTDPDFMAKATNFPKGEFVPAGYQVLGPPPPAPIEVVPMMGVHWLNVGSPELQPPTSPTHKVFSRTFVYGSWDGEFIFLEPMVTRDYLLTKPDETIPVPVPARYAQPGYFPSSYRVTFDPTLKEYHVAITGLTLHQ